MTIHLSIMLWLPAACGLLGMLPRARSRAAGAARGDRGAGYAIALAIDFKAGGGLQYVTTTCGSRRWGSTTSSASTGFNLFLVLLTDDPVHGLHAVGARTRVGTREDLTGCHFGLAHTAVLGALLSQDLALFVPSST